MFAAALALGVGAALTAWHVSLSAAAPTCTIFWTGATSSDWSTASNWSLTDGGPGAGTTPASTDYVCMSTAPTTAAVTLSTTAEVAGISWGAAGSVHPALTIENSLQVDTTGPSTIDGVADDGTLIAQGALTVNSLAFHGQIEGPAAVTIPAAGSLTAGGNNDGFLLAGADLINHGTATESASNGNVILEGASTFENAGSMSLADNGGLVDDDSANPSQFINDSGATVSYDGSTSGESSTVNVGFDNKGTITATAGILSLGNGQSLSSTSSGMLTEAAGATISLAGTIDLATGAKSTGAGTLLITSSTSAAGSNTLANVVDQSKLVAQGAVSVKSLALDGELDGPGTVTIPASGSLGLGASGVDAFLEAGADLVNDGTATEAANGFGTVQFFGGSTLESAGSIALADNGGMQDDDSTTPSQFINDPGASVTYDGSTPGETSSINVGFDNKGTIASTQGTLSLDNGQSATSTSSGTLTESAGATIVLQGTIGLASGATSTGAGTLQLTGTTTAAGANTLDGLDDQGRLVAQAAVTIKSLTLEGELDGPGAVTVPAGGSLALGAAGSALLKSSADLVNDGAATEASNGAGTVEFFGGSTLENGGSIALADNAGMQDEDSTTPSQFINDPGASVTYDGSTPGETSTINVGFDNKGTISTTRGTLSLGNGQSATSTSSGTFTTAAGATTAITSAIDLASGATSTGAGTLRITGTTTAAGSNTLDSVDDQGILVAQGAVTVPSLTLEGQLDGPGTVTVPAGGSLTFGGTAGVGSLRATADLVNDGTATQATNGTGVVEFFGGSTLENAGLISLADNAGMQDEDSTTPSQFINDAAGTVTYDGSTPGTSTSIAVGFDNTGAIGSTQGTLSLSNGQSASSKTSGTLSESAGATIALQGAIDLAHGATSTGAGTLQITGTTTAAGANALDGVDNQGRLVAQAAVTIKSLTLEGELDGPGKVTVPTGGSLALGGLVGTPSLQAAADLVNDGTAAEATNGTGDPFFIGGSTLENDGSISFADNAGLQDDDVSNPSRFINDSGAKVSYAGSSSTQIASVNIGFDNQGTISATAGTLFLTNGDSTSSTCSGTFSESAGGVIALQGAIDLASGATSTGAGTLQITGTTTTAAGANALGNVDDRGTLVAQAALRVQSLILEGVLDGPGKVTVAAGGSLTFGGPLGAGSLQAAADLVNDGTATEATNGTGEPFFIGGSTLENAGSISFADSAGLEDADGTHPSKFINDAGATVAYDGTSSSQTATVGIDFTNHGTVTAAQGTLSLPTLTNLSPTGTLTGGAYDALGGTLALVNDVSTNGGSIELGASPSAISGASANALTGLATNTGSLEVKQSLALTGALSNSGTVTIEQGTLSAGSFTQSAGTTTVNGGAELESGGGSGPIAIDGGVLTGTGKIAGNLEGPGGVDPVGAATGPMTINGNYDLSKGTLTVPVSGTSRPGIDYGQITVSGVATLGER